MSNSLIIAAHALAEELTSHRNWNATGVSVRNKARSAYVDQRAVLKVLHRRTTAQRRGILERLKQGLDYLYGKYQRLHSMFVHNNHLEP